MSIAATHVPTDEAAPRLNYSAAPRLRLLIYCAILVLLPAAFLLSAIPIVRSASFPGLSGDPFLLHPGYAASLQHVNCEILVYGDSTAATGIDPKLLTALTGLKSCNISQSQSIMNIVGPKALDDYLKNNNPPRFLVFQLAPETFSRTRPDLFWPEGLTTLVREELGIHTLYVLATNPAQAYGFALWAIKQRITAIHSPPDFSRSDELFRATGGLLVLPKPPETKCFTQWTFYPPDVAWIESLRAKYSRGNTRVLMDVSPVPDCSPDIGRIENSLKGITDNQLGVYPIDLFCDRDRHLTFQGAEILTGALARQILYLEDAKQ